MLISEVKASVPVLSGSVIVRTAVGSVTAKVVLLASTVDPSKINALVFCIAPEIVVLPASVVAPLTSKVVKAPVEAVVLPIGVLSIVPPLIVLLVSV